MKCLKDEEHAALKQKADNYDAVVQSILAKNENLKAEDVTPEVIENALNDADGDDAGTSEKINQLQSKADNLQEQLNTVTGERDALQTEVEELRELPGADSVSTKKPKAEASAVVTDDLLSFAQSNKGNTMGILAKMKEDGIL